MILGLSQNQIPLVTNIVVVMHSFLCEMLLYKCCERVNAGPSPSVSTAMDQQPDGWMHVYQQKGSLKGERLKQLLSHSE